jgi:hypothetical protein
MGKVIDLDQYRKKVEDSGYKFYYLDGYAGSVDLEDFQQVSANPGDVWLHYFGPGGQIEAPKV